MKLCVDCRHHIAPKFSGNISHMCSHPKIIKQDVVTGIHKYGYCEVERADAAFAECKPSALLFESRDIEPEKKKDSALTWLANKLF